MKEKVVVEMELKNNVTIEDSAVIKKVLRSSVLDSKIGRRLNKLDNRIEMSDEKRRKLLKNARDTGYFHLNGFADLYRDMIKISYVTLYRRLWANRDILKTLVELGYINTPYKNINSDDKFSFVVTEKYWKIQVCYSKRREFVTFIKNNYLTSEQKRG